MEETGRVGFVTSEALRGHVREEGVAEDGGGAEGVCGVVPDEDAEFEWEGGVLVEGCGGHFAGLMNELLSWMVA